MNATSSHSFARANRERFVAQLTEFLRIPSISTLTEHREDVGRAAAWLTRELAAIGMERVRCVATDSHPLVLGEWLHAPGRPTVLCYGHYDVQPAELRDGWESPPFEPVQRDGALIARGACDNKGPTLAILKAIESVIRGTGSLAVNVRVLLEGGEEIGSADAARFVADRREEIGCDAALVCDSAMFAAGTPSLTVGLRGICYLELEARGPRADLHSGLYGGAAPNPLGALLAVLASMKDENERVRIAGFYDRVLQPSAAELASWAALPFDEEVFRTKEVGSSSLTGEPGFSVLHRLWARPTLDVHGIVGGFTGEGAKTVIPAKATAKVSMRLVPDQDPDEILRLFSEHVARQRPAGVDLHVRPLGVVKPVLVRHDNRIVEAASQALGEVFGRDAVLVRCGGGIPIVGALQEALEVPLVLMGFTLPEDGAHGPNERISLANFFAGIDSIITFFHRLAN